MGQQERLRLTQVDKDVGHWVANIRTERGYTQRQLAHLAHTKQSAISRIENGKVSPSLTTLARMFKAMGVNLYIGCTDGK